MAVLNFRGLLIVLIVFVMFPVYAGLAVEPSRLYIETAPGKTVVKSVAIASSGAEFSIDGKLKPFILDSDGQPRLGRTAGDRDLHPWVRLVVAKNSVNLHIDVPSEAHGSYWGALVVGRSTPRGQGSEIVRTRVIVPVFVTIIGRDQRRVTISSADATTDGKDLLVQTVVRNESDTLARAEVSVVIERESDQAEIAEVTELGVLLLPRHSRSVVTRLRDRGASRDTAVVYLVYGASVADRAQARTSLTPRVP